MAQQPPTAVPEYSSYTTSQQARDTGPIILRRSMYPWCIPQGFLKIVFVKIIIGKVPLEGVCAVDCRSHISWFWMCVWDDFWSFLPWEITIKSPCWGNISFTCSSQLTQISSTTCSTVSWWRIQSVLFIIVYLEQLPWRHSQSSKSCPYLITLILPSTISSLSI